MSKATTTKPATPTDDTDDDAPVWPRRVTWRGMTFTIDNPDEWSLGALRAFETGRQVDAIARVLGDTEWSQIEDMPASQTLALFTLIAETAGFAGSGE